MEKGRLISFEGLDGAGKSTQMNMLARWLEEQHVPFIHTREPGGTPLGNEIRQLLLNRPELAIVALAEAFSISGRPRTAFCHPGNTSTSRGKVGPY